MLPSGSAVVTSIAIGSVAARKLAVPMSLVRAVSPRTSRRRTERISTGRRRAVPTLEAGSRTVRDDTRGGRGESGAVSLSFAPGTQATTSSTKPNQRGLPRELEVIQTYLPRNALRESQPNCLDVVQREFGIIHDE